MRIFKFAAVLVTVTLLASCGLFKSKTKASEYLKIEEVSKRDCVTVDVSLTKGEVKDVTVDKGSVVTEQETTTTTKKGGTTKVTVKKGDLKPGESFLQDSAGRLVKAILDTLNKTLTLELQVPEETTTVVAKERRIEQKDVTSERQERNTAEVKKQVAVAVQEEKNKVEKQKTSESKPVEASFWGTVKVVSAILVCCGFIVAAIVIFRKFRGKWGL